MAPSAAAFFLQTAALAAMLAAYLTPIEFHAGADQFGGQSQFLTIHGLYAAMFTMTLGILLYALPGATAIRSIKRGLLMVAMPVAAVISSIYWPLLLFFPHLIMPESPSDPAEPTSSSEAPSELLRIPLPVDLGLHALPGIALVLDFMFFEKKYSQKVASQYALPVAMLATLCYTSWAEYCASINGVFPYPFLNNPLEVRLGIYAGATAIAYTSFRVLNALHP